MAEYIEYIKVGDNGAEIPVRDVEAYAHMLSTDNPHGVTAEQVGAAPAHLKLEKLITASGWYKIGVLAGGFQYSGAITLYIGGQYYYSRPPVAVVDVVTTYDSAVVKPRVQAGDLITQVTKVGLAAESSSAFGVYVYYGSSSANTVEIKIDASRGGFTPVVLEASDVTESNMTSVAYLDEYENPPMVPGAEYRTTERYNGKPVYTRLLKLGTFSCDEETNMTPDGIDFGGTVIAYYGYIANSEQFRALPFPLMNVWVSTNNITVLPNGLGTYYTAWKLYLVVKTVKD